jgi:hypothetical protein
MLRCYETGSSSLALTFAKSDPNDYNPHDVIELQVILVTPTDPIIGV